MKKLFLLVLIAGFGLYTIGQQAQQFKVNVGEDYAPINNEQGHNFLTPPPNVKPPIPDITAGNPAKAVTIRELGNAGNAWGLSSGGRTFMWADNDIESVVFLHRMLSPPGTGYLAYDVSTDQGTSFAVDQQVWDPELYPAGAALGNARYPQVAIYNPAGNTDPANAVMTFFAPILDQSNGGSWGGYGMGTNPLTAVNPTSPTQMGLSSSGDLLYSVPDAYHITSDGRAICVEPALVDGLFANYTGSLVYTSGYYDEGTMLFDYQQDLVEFDISGGGEGVTISSSKIAFHPDGQVGYMVHLSNNGENDVADGAYYPILFKTTNGGEDWDGPYNVQLGGPDGLPAVLNYLTDELLEMLYEPPIPARDELLFTTAFDIDLAVDMYGNPHLLFVVGLGSGEWSIYTSIEGLPGTGGMIAMMHAASYDGMNTWYADTLNRPWTFRGEFAGSDILSEDLRPYIATTPDASKLFFSWQNTHIDVAEDNIAPDIYCIGYDVSDRSYTQLFNVSAFTAIMWQSWMATGSYYVFDDGAGNYEIPFVCQIMNPNNTLDPVQFRYVDDFVITDDDFGVWVSTAEVENEFISITNNYPNPCRDYTNVNMTLTEPAQVVLEVSNIMGQSVKTVNYGPYNKGLHSLRIDVTGLESGIYVYTLSTGKDAVSGKMIVE
ncbi:MAG TPA: T9SS type A sorting domain-containing protein [Bacteroidales bacterium]|nr:T9SS type A sorting domain-containing protein [Bacteroidales bacterium]